MQLMMEHLFMVHRDRSLMVDPLSYFLLQPLPRNWCNKGHGICCLWDGAYKITLAANQTIIDAVVTVGFAI